MVLNYYKVGPNTDFRVRPHFLIVEIHVVFYIMTGCSVLRHTHYSVTSLLHIYPSMSALGKQAVATATQLPNPHFQPSAKTYDSRAKGKLIMPDETPIKRPFKKAKSEQHKMTEFGTDVLKRMVNVSTNGGIPNGREIKGFLANYRTTPARIMCVCHGKCFTPAGFLEHAGGRQVPNPMQFIVLQRS